MRFQNVKNIISYNDKNITINTVCIMTLTNNTVEALLYGRYFAPPWKPNEMSCYSHQCPQDLPHTTARGRLCHPEQITNSYEEQNEPVAKNLKVMQTARSTGMGCERSVTRWTLSLTKSQINNIVCGLNFYLSLTSSSSMSIGFNLSLNLLSAAKISRFRRNRRRRLTWGM